MKWLSALTILFIGLSSHARQCSDLFEPKRPLIIHGYQGADYGELAPGRVKGQFSSRGVERARIGTAGSDGTVPYAVERAFKSDIEGGWQVTKILSIEKVADAFGGLIDGVSQAPAGLLHEVDRLLDFVLRQYETRRDWPASFRQKLRALAEKYLDVSTYVTVYEQIAGVTGTRILGTIRLIRPKDGILPLEEFLKVRLKNGTYRKIEPGNFAILRDANREVISQFLIQVLQGFATRDSSGAPYKLYTYADAESLTLYKWLGFKEVPMAEL
ncbi:MAG: hypothetical protein ABL958_03230, partial [Bdellovibrionia bacterium]